MDDEAGFKAWQAQAADRLKVGTETANPKAAEATKASPEIVVVDQATQDRLAERRSRDTAQAKEMLGLNAIEPALAKKRQTLDGDEEARAVGLVGQDRRRQDPT